MNISEIKKRYGIDTDDLDEIRGKLRKLIKENHPDSNDGIYDIDYFEQLKQDLNEVEREIKSINTSISIDSFFNTLIKNAQNYPQRNKQEELQEMLEKNIDAQIMSYKQKIRAPRYSLAAITAAITFLWMIPEQVASHPIVGLFVESETWVGREQVAVFLTVIWLTSCLILACYWITTARKERLEKILLERIKLSSIQNDIFMSFIEHMGEKQEFSKNEFMEYIKKYVYLEMMSREISRSEQRRMMRNAEIDEMVVQNLADIIIDRALSHGLIQKWDAYSLLDYYKIVK